MRNPSRILATLSLAVLPLSAPANEAIEAVVERALGAKPERISKTEYFGLYEVVVGGRVIYTDEKASGLLIGTLVDGKTLENVTGKRLFALLPLDLAVKQVRGNGKAMLVTFEDPNCGYCKRLAKDLAKLDNATIYTFLYPILSEDSADKSAAIWCAKDRAKAWNDWMVDNKVPPPVKSCEAPLERLVELGQRYQVSGTPTIFFADGSRAPGAIPLAQIRERLAQLAGK
jgi:thiol:disulfide interchange protein DsbC